MGTDTEPRACGCRRLTPVDNASLIKPIGLIPLSVVICPSAVFLNVNSCCGAPGKSKQIFGFPGAAAAAANTAAALIADIWESFGSSFDVGFR